MISALFRTVAVYMAMVAALRLMGKRQLGELQPSELVTTLMVSNVASVCIDEPDLPLFASLALILLLTVLEIFSSTLACLCPAYARLLFGKPITVIRDGEIVQSALPQLRITAGDLLEALRGKDIFSPADVLWAVVDIGYKLVAKTVAAIVLTSVMIDLFSRFVPAYHGDPILVALFAGLLEGLGLSLIFIRGATTGGSDLVARLLGRRLPHLSMGKLMLAVDGVVVAVSAFVFGSVENAMYACIVIFVSTKLIDAILYGADAGTGKLFFVMSPKVRQMGQRVIGELERTVTYLDSHGGYTKEPGETMLCAVRRFEVYQLQNIIREEDKDAFVIVGEAGQITGEGFRSMHSDDKPVKELLKELRQGGKDKE